MTNDFTPGGGASASTVPNSVRDAILALAAKDNDETTQKEVYNPATGAYHFARVDKAGKVVSWGDISDRPPSTGGSGGSGVNTGKDTLTEADLLELGFVKVGGGNLMEAYDPKTNTRYVYEASRGTDGKIYYTRQFSGAPPKGYKPPAILGQGAAATTESTPGTGQPLGASATANRQGFAIETHGTDDPVFNREEELQYQYNNADTNTSYSKGARYDDIEDDLKRRKKEEAARQALMEDGPLPALANGGNMIASGPQLITDMNTGQPQAVFGGAGTEMATFTPMERPSQADILREQQIAAAAVDPFAPVGSMSRAYNGQSSPELAMRIANEVQSANIPPPGYQRNPITGELELDDMGKRMLWQRFYEWQQGGMRGPAPNIFADGGTMTAVAEPTVLTIEDPYAFGSPQASVPATTPEPEPVPLPRPIPLPQDPFQEIVQNPLLQNNFWPDALQGGADWLRNKFSGTGQVDPITDPYANLPPDIAQRKAELESLMRQRGINAYKYGIAGLPQPAQTAAERVAEMQLAAINASIPGYAGSSAASFSPFKGLVDQQARSSADSRLRGQLGMSTAGKPPPAAPSVGAKPFPSDPFAFLNSLLGN